jgi:hypothetical protein
MRAPVPAEPPASAVVAAPAAAPKVTPKPAQPSPDTITTESIDSSYYVFLARPDSAETKAIQTAEGRVSRVGRELRVRFAGGRTGVYLTEGEERGTYRYLGYLKPMRAHVINARGMSGRGAFYVVDDSTADSIKVWGKPVLSPDGTRFVLMSMSDFADYDPTLIEIWRVVNRKPEREFSIEPEEYEPSDPVWRDSTTIDFIKNKVEGPPDKPYMKTPARLSRIGGKWVIDR